MNEVAYTHRAERQAQRCGVPPALIRTALEYADIELPVGGGRIAVRLSDEALYELEHDQGTALADRAASIVLILADETLVTVLRAIGKPSRRYLRRQR